MKFLFTLIYIFSLILPGVSQTVQKDRKVVHVLTPQTFYLNGGTRATFGGKSRAFYNISLPANTVEWYYSFTTTKNEVVQQPINLYSQIAKLFNAPGLIVIAANALLTPTGAGVCDIYLMDKDNCERFMDKSDNWGGSLKYNTDGSRQNFKNGTVQVKDLISGNWCLGFKNPSASEGIYVTFEVVAIVEESPSLEIIESEKKAEVYGKLGWKAFENTDYDKSLEYSLKAIELNPQLGWVYSNMGLVYLLKKDLNAAIESYSTAITLFKKSDNPSKWLNEAIKNLEDLINENAEIDGAEGILETLRKQ